VNVTCGTDCDDLKGNERQPNCKACSEAEEAALADGRSHIAKETFRPSA
jgi:hypothetical protein